MALETLHAPAAGGHGAKEKFRSIADARGGAATAVPGQAAVLKLHPGGRGPLGHEADLDLAGLGWVQLGQEAKIPPGIVLSLDVPEHRASPVFSRREDDSAARHPHPTRASNSGSAQTDVDRTLIAKT